MSHRYNIAICCGALALLLGAAPAWAAVIDYVDVVCPVSGHGFFGMNVAGVNTLSHRDGDFLVRVEGGNHYATRVWTCPYCFFSAYPEVFEQGTHVDFDPSSIVQVALSWEAKESKDVQSLIPIRVKYENAAAYYYSIGKPPYFMGVLNLQGSWAARLSKVSLPQDVVSMWHQFYMRSVRNNDSRSKEEVLEEMADSIEKELKTAGSKAEKDDLSLLLASTLRQSGQHRRAIPLLRDLVSNAQSSELSSAAGDELELAKTEMHFQQEALRYFKEAVKLGETLPEDRLQSIYLIGELSRRLGDLEQAKEWFGKSAETPMPQRWAREILKRQRQKLADEIAAR
jgi:uncharacterized protein (DUF2225 family)